MHHGCQRSVIFQGICRTISTRVASELDIKTDHVLRFDSSVKLVISIECYSYTKIDSIYLIDVHNEKYDDRKGYIFAGNVYIKQNSVRGPIYFDKDSLFRSLTSVVQSAIVDFLRENRKKASLSSL
jgi:hypothetical protein